MDDQLYDWVKGSIVSSTFALLIGVAAVRIMLDEFRRILELIKQFRQLKGSASEKRSQLDEIDQSATHSAVANAELILHLLLSPDEAEAVGGDLEERFSTKVKRFGKRRARIWLWSQVLRSIWPLVKRFFTAGGFLAAAEFIRKLLS